VLGKFVGGDLDLRLHEAVLAQLPKAAGNCDEEERVLEGHPREVLERPPPAGGEHAVHRLRPERPAQRVVEHRDERRGEQHPPVAIPG
jgi:hypothetical protein